MFNLFFDIWHLVLDGVVVVAGIWAIRGIWYAGSPRQWLRWLTLGWADTTAHWVISEDVWRLIDAEKFDEARAAVKAAEDKWKTTTVDDPEIVRAETLISFMDSPLDD